MPLSWRRGLHVVGTSVWCDARRVPGIVFASRPDAEASGLGLFGTSTTSKLRAILGLAGDVLCAPYGRRFSLGPVSVELFPSGLMPGAAGALFEVGGERLAYLGALGDAGAEHRPCDVLCVYAPPRSDAKPPVPALCAGDRTQTVIFLVPGLTEAFSLAQGLSLVDIPLRAPPRLRAALRQLGQTVLPFRGTPAPGEAMVWPLAARRADAIVRIAAARHVVLPEKAASGDALLSYVRQSGAKEVAVVGLGAPTFVLELRALGMRANSLGANTQLGLFREAPCSA